MMSSLVSSSVPYDTDGIHHGFLSLHNHKKDTAWNNITVPISVIRNGNGPVALLTDSNHNDEYEGPIALHELATTLPVEQVQGTVIIVPRFNHPMFIAGTRTTPVDSSNRDLNDPDNTEDPAGEVIADYFERTLIPMADIILGFRSSANALDFLPYACVYKQNNIQQELDCTTALKAFNAPYSFKLLEIERLGQIDKAIDQQGKVYVSTALSSGSISTAMSVKIARKGIRNLLKHAGILQGEPELEASIQLNIQEADGYVFSKYEGVVEPVVELGETVKAGDTIARVWSLENNGTPPVNYHANCSGILAARHSPGVLQTDDCIAIVAVVVNDLFT